MQIGTVVLGFLQICAGVVLLQLSKSAKDVPDAAVFKGDLDQVREVGTQEEPESEPKADAIRGTAAIIRRLSTPRRNVEAEEARRYHNERSEDLKPPAENEVVEWDGLRRRKTVLSEKSQSQSQSQSHSGSQLGSQRRTTPLPPLGMSRFPDDWEDDPHATPSVHSFMNEIRSRTSSIMNSPWRPINDDHEPLPTDSKAIDRSKPGIGHPRSISWADEEQNQNQTHLAAPQPPPRRHFSFHNIFNRAKSPVDRSAQRSRSPPWRLRRRGHIRSMASEEEHLGLVEGDTVGKDPNENTNSPTNEIENEKLERDYDDYNDDGHHYGYDTYGYDQEPDHLPSGQRLASHSSLYPPRLRVNPLPPLPDDESALDLSSESSPNVDETEQKQPESRPSIQPHPDSKGSLLAVPRRQGGWRRHNSASSAGSQTITD